MASTLLSFFGLIMILPIVSSLMMVAEVEPWFIVTYSAGLITDVFLQPTFGGGGGPGGSPDGFTSYSPQFTTGVEVMAAYAMIFFLIAIFLSTRRDVE
jgi:preprotein translocase subunit SecG